MPASGVNSYLDCKGFPPTSHLLFEFGCGDAALIIATYAAESTSEALLCTQPSDF